MTRFIRLSLCIISMLGFVAVSSKAVDRKITLVKNGKANSTIITAKKPTPAVHLAAIELQYFIKLMTGVKLPIADDSQSISGVKVLIGKNKFTDQLGINDSKFGYMDTLIKFGPDMVVLFGRDEAKNDTMPKSIILGQE